MLRMKVTWSEQYMKQYGDPEALMTKAVLGIMKKAVDADVSQQHGDLSKAEAGFRDVLGAVDTMPDVCKTYWERDSGLPVAAVDFKARAHASLASVLAAQGDALDGVGKFREAEGKYRESSKAYSKSSDTGPIGIGMGRDQKRAVERMKRMMEKQGLSGDMVAAADQAAAYDIIMADIVKAGGDPSDFPKEMMDKAYTEVKQNFDKQQQGKDRENNRAPGDIRDYIQDVAEGAWPKEEQKQTAFMQFLEETKPKDQP